MVTDIPLPIGNSDLVRQLNSAAVYRLIDQYGPISRIQLAEYSQLAPASITKITRQLLERRLIKEVAQQASTGGRRAISIVAETRAFQTLGVRLGRHNATLALYNLSGKVLASQCVPLPYRTVATLEPALFSAIARFLADWQRKIHQLIAIAVVLPGLVDEHGVVSYMPHVSVSGWPLADNLQKRFTVFSYVGHDIRCLALAEHYFGASQDCADSVLVRLHRGTGAGIIINGQIFRGQRNNIGEIGHIQVDPLGARCHCGNFGCLETIAANAAIEQRVRQCLAEGYHSKLTAERSTIQHIARAARQGDPLAEEVVKEVGRWLGKVIALTVNILNPQKIVIAGEITEAGDVLLDTLKSSIQTQTLNAFHQHLPVVYSQLDHCSAIGAFALVKQALLSGELLQKLLDAP